MDIMKTGIIRWMNLLYILHANRAYYALTLILKSHAVHRAEKIKIYKSLIRPVITYGAEASTLNTETAKNISCFWEEGSSKDIGCSEGQ